MLNALGTFVILGYQCLESEWLVCCYFQVGGRGGHLNHLDISGLVYGATGGVTVSEASDWPHCLALCYINNVYFMWKRFY